MAAARDTTTSAATARRPPLTVGSGTCECGGCGVRFRSVTAFDKHRVGPGDARRCLTETEMREAGMFPNEWGQWVSKAYDR
jgi:hypothetical protein